MSSGGGPLAGRRIMVTRPQGQAADLIAGLEAVGARVDAIPLIRIAEPADTASLDAAARRIDHYDWTVFTSVNGVAALAGALRRVGGGAAALAGATICAIGPATAAAVEGAGGRAALVASEHVAEGVVDTLRAQGGLLGARILLPQAELARGVLAESLRGAGADVTAVVAYRTLADRAGAREARRRVEAREVDMLTFTSSSAVESYLGAGGGVPAGVRIASIGPITSRTARSHGLEVDVEAEPYTAEGLITAIVRYYGDHRHAT